MNLTPEQRKMIDDFISMHIPGARTFIQFPGHKQIGRDNYYGGIEQDAALVFTVATLRPILFEQPQINYEKFEAEALRRIKELDFLSKRTEKYFKGHTDAPSYRFAGSFFFSAGQSYIPFDRQVKSFSANAALVPAWLKNKPFKMGNYTVKQSILAHPETPFSIEVLDQRGLAIATFGGFLAFQGKRPTLMLTNIQGKPVICTLDESKKIGSEPPEQYKELNHQLQEGWRVFFAKKIVEAAKQRGIQIVGHLPLKEYFFEEKVPDRKLKRQKRQYRQTYRKAGLKEQPDGTWKSVAVQRPRRGIKRAPK